MTGTATAAPRWDVGVIFPSLESPEFAAAFDGACTGIDALVELYDRHNVRKRAEPTVDAAFAAAFEEVVTATAALYDCLTVLGSYLLCLTTTNAADEAAQARMSELDVREVPLGKLSTRLTAWLGSTDEQALKAASPVALEHAYFLRKATYRAEHQLSEELEALATDLAPVAITAWSRLHGTMTALLTARVPVDGVEQELPMSAVRALANHRDRRTRRAAYEAEIAAWKTVEVPLAAAMNGVKGYQRTLRQRRGYATDVEPTLFGNGIDQPTLDAMQEACVASFPQFRRYMAAKAQGLGLDKLAWYDLQAPVGHSERRWSWAEAEEFIVGKFGAYSPRLADFAARSFRERWIDAEPRVGKEGGAYCTRVRRDESRIMMNFDGSFGSISTLAHELGHAYHNLNLAPRTALLRSTPSTAAETASIFCETLAFEAALEASSADERVALLDNSLEGSLQVVVDIHSRFLFEQAVFERRGKRDLTVTEFKELMTWAQSETYGDGVDPAHPYMWAVKSHYYGPTFYNYPYTFGLLFGLGLYSLYQRDPEAFRGNYDGFLSATGMDDAVSLAARFGIDVRDTAFWAGGLGVIGGQVNEFVALASLG
jgi:pepF/M3 family oligoendopeptidase